MSWHHTSDMRACTLPLLPPRVCLPSPLTSMCDTSAWVSLGVGHSLGLLNTRGMRVASSYLRAGGSAAGRQAGEGVSTVCAAQHSKSSRTQCWQASMLPHMLKFFWICDKRDGGEQEGQSVGSRAETRRAAGRQQPPQVQQLRQPLLGRTRLP